MRGDVAFSKGKECKIMNERKVIMLSVLMVLGLVAMLTGCQSTADLKAERDALFAQNTELQDELDQTRTALEAAEADRVAISDQVDDLEAKLADARASKAPALQANTGFDDISGVEIIHGAGRVTIRVPGDVLFASGKVSVKDNAKKTLARIADVIKSDYPRNTIRIEGYTDSDKIKKSGWKDNLQLSMERAAAVQRYLASKGVDDKKMYAAGFGASKPKSSKAASRRVEVVVVLDY